MSKVNDPVLITIEALFSELEKMESMYLIGDKINTNTLESLIKKLKQNIENEST